MNLLFVPIVLIGVLVIIALILILVEKALGGGGEKVNAAGRCSGAPAADALFMRLMRALGGCYYCVLAEKSPQFVAALAPAALRLAQQRPLPRPRRRSIA